MKTEASPLRRLGVRYPIVAAPMLLISNPKLLQSVAESGAIAAIPSLNFRTHEEFREFLASFPALPFGVNLVLKANTRLEVDLAAVVERQVPLVITSLGDPAEVIAAVHNYGGQVWCDVATRRHGEKAATAGADLLVALGAGAGGHSGWLSPLVLGPWLKRELGLPFAVAGGLATGAQLLAVLALGAEAGYFGTRFIASIEAGVASDYQAALIRATPEDLEFTDEVSGIRGNFLKEGLERFRNEGAIPWKEVWSAGQGVAFIDSVLPVSKIIAQIIAEYEEAYRNLSRNF